MAVRDIVIWPDKCLKDKAEPVSVFDESLQDLLDDMLDTMYAADGIGLAAPQIGVSLRAFVVDPGAREGPAEPRFFINPEVVEAEGEIWFEEGCLSVPGEVVEVKRYTSVKMRALGGDGEPFEITANDLLAIALQHELDHIDGMLIVDRLSTIKRTLVKKRMRDLKEGRQA